MTWVDLREAGRSRERVPLVVRPRVVQRADGPVAGCAADAVEWRDSGYSAPGQNGVKACVQVAVVPRFALTGVGGPAETTDVSSPGAPPETTITEEPRKTSRVRWADELPGGTLGHVHQFATTAEPRDGVNDLLHEATAARLEESRAQEAEARAEVASSVQRQLVDPLAWDELDTAPRFDLHDVHTEEVAESGDPASVSPVAPLDRGPRRAGPANVQAPAAPVPTAPGTRSRRWYEAPSIRAFFHREIAALRRRLPAPAASGAAAQEPGPAVQESGAVVREPGAAAGSTTEFAPLRMPEGVGDDFEADVMHALDAIVASADGQVEPAVRDHATAEQRTSAEQAIPGQAVNEQSAADVSAVPSGVLDPRERLEDWLSGVLPPYELSARDCVPRLEALRRARSGATAVARDDLEVGSARPEAALAAATGGAWRPVDSSLAGVAEQVRDLGPGAYALVLTSPPIGPRHGYALLNEDGELFWVETQERPGSRVRAFEDGSLVPGVDTRAIVVDPATGRAAPPPGGLAQAANTRDAVLIPSTEQAYDALGRELETGFVVRAHNGRKLPKDRDVMLVYDRYNKIRLMTDTMKVYFAGNVVRVKIIEIVLDLERVIPDLEGDLPSSADVKRAVREIIGRLRRAAAAQSSDWAAGSRGTPLKELFPEEDRWEYGELADHITIIRPPWPADRILAQFTLDVPVTRVPDFLLSAALHAEASARKYLPDASKFARRIVRSYLEDRLGGEVGPFAGLAMEFVPGVAAVRGAMTLLATHALAVAAAYLSDKGLPKDKVFGTLRDSFGAVREGLPEDVQRFLERHAEAIRKKVWNLIRARLDDERENYTRRQSRAREPVLHVFDYPLEYGRDRTLRDYVNALLLPPGRRRVGQYEALGVRTDFTRLNSRFRRAAVRLEMRNLTKQRKISLDEQDELAATYAGIARDEYLVAQRMELNGTTRKGLAYVEALSAAVRAVSAHRPARPDVVSQVRDFLDEAARQAIEPLRAPIFQEDVTTNLLADAVLALHDVMRFGGGTAPAARAAVEAVREAVLAYLDARSGQTSRRQIQDFQRHAHHVVQGLRDLGRGTDRTYELPIRRGPAAPVIRAFTEGGPAPVPVKEPGSLVAMPATSDWVGQREDAPRVWVRTERFDPGTGFTTGKGPEDDGWTADIGYYVQRVQAVNGQWVRYQVAVLPVKPMEGATSEEIEALQARLNEALDAYVNRGYELPVSKDQLHLAVKLVHAPEHPRAIEVRPGSTGNGPDVELDTRHWGLEDYIYALVHEVLHYFGLGDEYQDSRSLFRRRAGSSAVKMDGLMAGGVFDPAQPVPARHLRMLESVVVVHQFATTAEPRDSVNDLLHEATAARLEESRAQETEARAEVASSVQRQLVDPLAWEELDAAPRFDLHRLLADAAGRGYTAEHADESVVSHIREHVGRQRSLVFTVGPDAQVREYRVMLQWAVRMLQEDMHAIREEDPSVSAPYSLKRYRERLASDGLLIASLGHSVGDEITAIINVVDRVHRLRPDNPDGRAVQLPPEVGLFSLDPVMLAREVAYRLGLHVRLEVWGPGGRARRHWADPSGRIYAFNPTTFNDAVLPANLASRVGLWRDEVRRRATAYGFGPVELGRFYRTSWADRRTFEQAVTAAVSERREYLRAVHGALPALFERAVEAAGGWEAEVVRVEDEQAALLPDITRAEEALERARDRVTELALERFRRAVGGGTGAAAGTREQWQATAAETAARRRLDEYDQRNTSLAWRLSHARGQLGEAERLLADLRATTLEPEGAGRARWSDEAVQAATTLVTGLESLADDRRVRRADPGAATSGGFDLPPEVPAFETAVVSAPVAGGEQSGEGGARSDTPLPPWYVNYGAFGDGGVSSMADVVAESVPAGRPAAVVDRWISAVTAGMKAGMAGKVRAGIVALLADDDPRAWERLLLHGALIVEDGMRVRLTFTAESLEYVPPGGEVAEPGQVYFSKYGDTTYSEGESRHRRTARSVQAEAVVFLQQAAQGAVSHVSPSVKIGMESGFSSGFSISEEKQSGTRVIANAVNGFAARIRVRATVNRRPRDDLVLPGTARLAFPTVYTSAAQVPAAVEEPGTDGHPTVGVVDTSVLQGLDYAVNAANAKALLDDLATALEEELGLPAAAVDEIRQEIAEEYLNEKTLKDRSQWWLTDSWVTGLLSEKLSRWSSFSGHLEIGAKPLTVRYVMTTDEEVLLRNDIADTVMFRHGGEHDSSASITPGVAIGVELGDHLATPSFDLPKVSSVRGHGYTVSREGQAKNATMRKDRLVCYRTVVEMSVRLFSNKGAVEVTGPVLGELGIGREHAKEFERRALGGVLTGSGLVDPAELTRSAPEAETEPEAAVAGAVEPRPRDEAGFVRWLRSRFGGKTPPAAFPEGGVGGAGDLVGLADRGPIEIAVPPRLYRGLTPRGLREVEGGLGLLLHSNVTWVLMGSDSSTVVSHAAGPGDAPWRYILDDEAGVVGALFMGERQPSGVREPSAYVPNPAAVPLVSVVGPRGGDLELNAVLHAAGLDAIADFVADGGVPQVQLANALRSRLEEATPEDGPLRSAVELLRARPGVHVIAADGRPLTAGDAGDGGSRPVVPPERRFVIDGDGVVHGPLRPWYHVVHPREPKALAARRGFGRGIVREMPGLEVVYREAREELRRQIREAGVEGKLSPFERQHQARVFAMKFGVPGVRGAAPTLIDTGISYEVRIGGYIFSVLLDADLRALRAEPKAESGVTLDSQRKGVMAVDVEEKRGWGLGAGFNIRFRLKLARLFSMDIDALKADYTRSWVHTVIGSRGVKEYRRDRTGGDVTRFEYATAYNLAVMTRVASSGEVVRAEVREISGDEYWSAVSVSNAYLPEEPPVPADAEAARAIEAKKLAGQDALLSLGRVTVAHGRLDDEELREWAGRPGQGPGEELELNKGGLSGVQVGLVGLGELSAQLAEMVAEHNGVSWAGAKADPFQQVLAKIVPSGRNFGVAQRIVRGGTQTFLEANARTMIRKRGLVIALPPTGGWRQYVRIRMRTFNARHEKTLPKDKGVSQEQYTEVDLRPGEHYDTTDTVAASGGVHGVIRPDAAPAAEGGHTTSQKSTSQILFGGGGGGEGSRGRHDADMGGALDLNLGTYSGDSELVGADPVFTIEHVRWRRRKRMPARPKTGNVLRKKNRRTAPPLSYTMTRQVKIEGGAEILFPHVRAADHGLIVRDDLPADHTAGVPGERGYLQDDLAMGAGYVEDVEAEAVLDTIETMLGPGADPDLLSAVGTAFNEEALRAQYPIARRGGVLQVFKVPAEFWREHGVWDHMKMHSRTSGTVNTGIRVRALEDSITYRRPRPDVRVTTGGQAFVQQGKAKSRGRVGWGSGVLHGRWASAPFGLRPAAGVAARYQSGSTLKTGKTWVTRDIRRATAKDASQEFTHTGRFRIEVFHSYSPAELRRRAGQVLSAGPALVEVLTLGESRRMWQRLFPPSGPAAATDEVPARAAVLVPTHLTTTDEPSVEVRPARTAAPVISHDTPASAPSALAMSLAEHAQALSLPESQTLAAWAPVAAMPWRRVDRRAVAQGQAPIAEGFWPVTQDGLTLDLALDERASRADIASLLLGEYGFPLANGDQLTVQLVLPTTRGTRGRWLTRGGYTALNFPEHAAEPELEREGESGWTFDAEFDIGHKVGQPLREGVETPLLDAGGAYGRQGQTSHVEKNTAAEYVESNRQHDGDFDYYLFKDAEYHITGPHRHRIVVPIENGLVAMLPATVVSRLLTGDTPLPLERPPLGEDQLPAEWAQDGTLPPGATAQIVQAAGGPETLRTTGTLRLWTRADHLTTATTTARELAAEISLPVELLVRDDDGTIHRHLVTETDDEQQTTETVTEIAGPGGRRADVHTEEAARAPARPVLSLGPSVPPVSAQIPASPTPQLGGLNLDRIPVGHQTVGGGTTRQLFRVDVRTGASELVEVAVRRGRRLNESAAGDGSPDTGPASVAADAGGAEARRYTYHRADPETGVMTETHLGPDEVVLSARPASGQVYTQFAYRNGARVPYGDPDERMPVYDTANGTWDVVTTLPKPVGSGSGSGSGSASGRRLASRGKGTGPYQVLRRDGEGNVDLLTYERRPADVPGPGGVKSDGHQYHSLEAGGQSGWRDGNPLGTPRTIDRISWASQGARLDGRPVEDSRPSAVLVRDQDTGLYQKLTPTSSNVASESSGRAYYRFGPDGRLRPVTVQGQRVHVVRVSADGRTVTRTTFSPSGDGTARLYVGEDGALSPDLPQTISASDLRYNRETGQIVHKGQDSAGPNAWDGSDHDAGTPGGGAGLAARTYGTGARTHTRPDITTFTDDNPASAGEASSRPSDGEGVEPTGLEMDDRFHGEGGTVGVSADRPDAGARADAFERLFEASVRQTAQRTVSGSDAVPRVRPHHGEGTGTAEDGGSGTVTRQVGPRGGSADPPDADVEVARRRLGKLSERVYEGVMAEAGAIVADVGGRVPSVRDGGGRVSAVDRVRLQVAVAIARSGREAGEGLARVLLRFGAADPVLALRGGRGDAGGVSGDPADADVEVARRRLGRLSERVYEGVMAEAGAIVADVGGRVPSVRDGGGRVSAVDRVRLQVAVAIARSGRQAGEDLVRTLVPLTLGARTVATPALASAESLPFGMAEQWLPATSADAFVVRGRTLADGRVVVGESAMTPDEFVVWLGGMPGFGGGPLYRPVVLLFADAGRFASVVAARYGRPVVAPWGGFVALPSGRVMAGTAVRTPGGGVSLVATPLDTFHVFAPDGQTVPLTRELGSALELLGVRLTAPAELPVAVMAWGEGQGARLSELGDLSQNPDLHWLPVVAGVAAPVGTGGLGAGGGPAPALPESEPGPAPAGPGGLVADGGPPPTPPEPEPGPAPGDAPLAGSRRPVYPVPEIEERRPVGLRESTPAVPDPERVWQDGGRLPEYFHEDGLGLGHGDIGFRGQAEMLAGLQPLDLPRGTWDEIKAALAEEPESFLGDGRPFTVAPSGQQAYEIVIAARSRGEWDRFYDVDNEKIRVDKRTTQTSNLITDKTFGTSRHGVVPIPLGPGPTPGTGFGQLSLDVIGNERSYTYGYGTTGVAHEEVRVSGGSHVHIDDLDFVVRTYRGEAGGRREVGTPVRFTVLGALRVRVPDRLTVPADTDLPQRFDFNGLVPDTYHVEGVGSVAPVFDQALNLFPSTIGSSAYETLRRTISRRAFVGGMGEMVDEWGLLQEIPGAKQDRPEGGLRLGARLISAELLVAGDGHEIRVGRSGGSRAEVTAAMTNAFQLSGIGGPMATIHGVVASGRIQGGLTGQAGWSWRESAMSGGTASRKRLAVTSGTSGLYKVAVEYVMQRTGSDEATVVPGHVLLRLPESEARRLAAGQGTAPVADQAAQPVVPPYLSEDRPRTLGLHDVRSLTGIRSLRRRAIAALAQKYPNLLAPWDELDPADERWAGRPDRYKVVLRNTIQVMRFLSLTSIAAHMDTLISTGLRLSLPDYTKFRKEYVTLKLTADLRARRYAGPDDIGMRVSSILADRIDWARNIQYSASLGFMGRAQLMDVSGTYTGAFAASWRYLWQQTRMSAFGQAVSADDQVVAKGESHLFAYDVEFHLEAASYDRPRNAYRAGTLDVLAHKRFVRKTPWTPVLAEEPATGMLTIRVPDSLTSALAGPIPAPTRPDAGTGTGVGTDTRDWRHRMHTVIGVTGTKRLNDALQRRIAQSQENSWLFTEPGTTVHEVVQHGLTADAHAANFLRMATGGWSMGPLLAKRPVQDRIGAVAITSRVSRMRAVSGLISGLELELEREGVFRAGHGASRAQGHGATVSGSFGAKPTLGGTDVTGTYGPLWTIYDRLRTSGQSASLAGVNLSVPTPSGRFVLVAADVTYTVRAQGRRTGRLAPKWAVTTRTRGKKVRVRDGVYMLLPEDDARDMGLIPRAPGPEPDYGSVTVPGDYLSVPLGWAPENAPDATEAVALLRAWFADQASGIGPSRYAGLLPDTELEDLADNLKHLTSATSALGMAGLLGQLVADGVPLRLLQGRGYLPWTNAARVWIRVQLGAPTFLRAAHNVEIEEYPQSREGEQSSRSVSRSKGFGFSVTEAPWFSDSPVHHEQNSFADGAALTQTDTQSQARGSTAFRGTLISPQATAKLSFPTTVILSVEENGQVVHSVAAPGGPLVAHVPWTFTVPTARPAAAMGAPLRSLTPNAPGQQGPMALPETAAIVNVGGVSAIRHVGMASVAALEGAPDHRVGRTPLTQGGNVAGEMLANELSQPVLCTFFPQATRPGGVELPELSEIFITGGATARPTAHAAVDLGGGVLVSVSDGHRWDVATRRDRGATTRGTRTDGRAARIGAGPTFATTGSDTGPAPIYAAGMTPDDHAWGESDAAGQSTQVDDSGRLLLKNEPGRSFVFCFPVDWRITTTGTRGTFSRAGAVLTGKGPLRPQTKELRVEKGVWIRLGESDARELGLITEENFPAAVAAEWDTVEAANNAWKSADKAFRDARDDVTAAAGAVDAAARVVTEAETALAEHPLDPAALAAAIDAHTALADARSNAPELTAAAETAMNAARTAAEQAAATFRDLRASAVAMTTWYRTPATERTGHEPRPRRSHEPAPPPPPSPLWLPTIPEQDEAADKGSPATASATSSRGDSGASADQGATRRGDAPARPGPSAPRVDSLPLQATGPGSHPGYSAAGALSGDVREDQIRPGPSVPASRPALNLGPSMPSTPAPRPGPSASRPGVLNVDAVPVGHQTADGGVDAQAALGVRERLL